MTKEEILQALCHDSDPWVRSGVAKVSSIPAVQRILVSDTSMIVRFSLLENPALAGDVLEALTKDADATVSITALTLQDVERAGC